MNKNRIHSPCSNKKKVHKKRKKNKQATKMIKLLGEDLEEDR